MAFSLHKAGPALVFDAPAAGTAVGSNTPLLEVRYTDLTRVIDPSTLEFTANGAPLAVSCTHTTTGASCTHGSPLPDGSNTVTATVADYFGLRSAPADVTFTVDTVAPTVTLTAPADGLVTSQSQQVVEGEVSEGATLIVTRNGEAVETFAVPEAAAFASSPVPLAEGANLLEVRALDRAGHPGQASRQVTLDTQPPDPIVVGAVTVSPPDESGEVTVTGAAGSVEAGARVTVTNLRTLVSVTVVAGADGSFVATLAAQAGDQVRIVVGDEAGNTSGPTETTVPSAALPPDPATVAPALDPSVASDLATATSFLYTGPNSIQTGVAPGTIEPKRAAVLRGVVKTRDGAPLPGVTITIPQHPEYGQTLSRADGAFDLAVNGGGLLTVEYRRAGYLPAQRQVRAPWQDYAWLPEVVLVPLDAQATVVDLSGGAGAMQVAQGSVVTDADGTRRATLLVPAGTAATMVLPDGTTQPLTTGAVRATEYTVGATGPQAMPAELPPTSAYTYAVELSVDEAVAAGATAVRFDQPVINYVENFVGFPVGGAVPTGYYDREQARWIPSTNGRVVQVLGVTGGLAELDVTGDGVAASPEALAALGVTDAERQQLATLYPAGQTLWRVPLPHLTPWDHNWPYGPPADAQGPQQPLGDRAPTLDSRDCTICEGSIIEAENQILGESLRLTGSPFILHYRTDRVPGARFAYALNVPVSGATVPPSLRRIEVEIGIAGQLTRATLLPLPDQRYQFEWNGLDAYGRLAQGRQAVRLRLGYVYPAVYQTPANFEASFGAVSGIPISADEAREEITIWQEQAGQLEALGTWDARGVGLGGWTLDVHHTYDPGARVIHLGDGGRRSAHDVTRVISTVAGGLGPSGLAVGADGAIFVSDGGTVRRMAPDGTMSTVAGNGTFGFSGDGGPATDAALAGPAGLALGPDGSLYITDTFNNRIRRVTPDGVITTVAGQGGEGFTGDGGPATAARLYWPSDVAVGPDGALYIADTQNHRIRRVGSDGVITTAAGGPTPSSSGGFGGDGGPATAAQLDEPYAVTVGLDGSLLIADFRNRRIRRVSPDGVITTVAGTGEPAPQGGDGGLATAASIGEPRDVVSGGDGAFYLSSETLGGRVRRVGPDGVITTVAGNGSFGTDTTDGSPATQVPVSPYALAVAPDETLYIGETTSLTQRLRRVGPPLPGFAVGEQAIPSEDAQEIYVMDGQGRHLRTTDALTGAVLYSFGYDEEGRLSTVRDRAGLVTQIERDLSGAPTAIVAPGGQRTEVTLDAQGFLATVTNPASETVTLTTSTEGLLTAMRDPRGNLHQYQYDSLGYLVRDTDPAGGFAALQRTDTADTTTTRYETGEGRVSSHRVEQLPTGGTRLTTTDPSGLVSVREVMRDGRRVATSPDGTVSEVLEGPDPRFGMQAPIATAETARLPSGLTSSTTRGRSVVLDDPSNLLSLRSQTDTTTVNGRTYTQTYEALTRTLATRTPAGRELISTLDALGRLAEVRAPGVAPVTLTYDARGRLATVTEGTGPDARVSTLSYDAQDRLVGLVDAEDRATSFTYDAAGRVLTQTLPGNRVIALGYDANGNVTSVTPPERPAHAFGYTPVDLEERYDPPVLPEGPTPTTSAYNTDKQPTLVTQPGRQTLSLGYDSAGRLATITQPRGTTTLAYDPTRGTLASVTAPDGGTLAYTYDGALLTSVTWGSGPVTGSVSWTYDSDFRVASETVGGQAVSFGYDPDSLLTQAGALSLTRDPQTGFLTGTTLGVVTDSRTYTTFGEPQTYAAQVNGTPVLEVAYVRDALERIVERTETIEGTTTVTGYRYDAAGRLDQVTTDGVVTAEYGYDPNGNRLSATTPGGTATGTYDAQDRLLTYGDATYTYTANGELRTKTDPSGTTTYTYL